MAGFLDYLDNFEKKFEKKITETVEQPKKVVVETKKVVSTPKKIIRIIKKEKVENIKPKNTNINENINHASNLLDGIEEGGYTPYAPSSTRYYDNTGLSSKQNINISKDISSMASSILDDDNSSTNGFSGGMPQPLRDVPELDLEMLKFVPKEMLTQEQQMKVQSQQVIEQNQNKVVEVPPEIQALMEQTKQMQQIFNQNIDMSGIPPEFLN